MASFLYYFYEVNVMNCILSWINGSTITFINFLSKLEWGTVADWVSGIGSLGAIIFAYWQMNVRRKKEEKDIILANRPFFSFIKLQYLKIGKDHLWLIGEDDPKKINSAFEKVTETTREFKKDIFAYEFKNVSQALATNVVLKIEYQNEAKDKVIKTDYCNIGTCVVGNERAIMMPHSIMNEASTYSFRPKRLYLYFTTVDERAYCQRWIEEFDKFGNLCIARVDIIEVPKEEMPDEGKSNCWDIN